MAPQCALQADNVFTPVITSDCRGGFDFTLLFEQSILGILPGLLFILACSTRYFYLARKPVKTSASTARLAKLIVSFIFAGLQLTLLVLWCLEKSYQTRISIASAAINLIVALQILGLSWIEDSRSVRPSTLINLYLIFTLLFDIAQDRTLWLRQDGTALPAMFSASIVVKLALLFLEARSKRSRLQAAYKELPPEESSGIINRSLLWWVNHLFRRGLRAPITFEDLYALDSALTSEGLSEMLEYTWQNRRKPERRFELPWVICKTFWRPLFWATIPRLCLIGFTFAQPFLISRVLTLLFEQDSQLTSDEGYGLIGATALIYLGIAITTLHYNQNFYRFLTMFRGGTVALIYNHSLVIQDGLYSESAAVTLMSADVDRIALCLANLNECWARTIEVAIGIALLALQLGWVCVIPVIIVVISFFGSAKISKTIGGKQKIWVDAVQIRVSITSSILAGMKGVKMLGLSQLLTRTIQDLRVEETHKMAGFRWSIVWQNIVQNLPWAIAPALTLTAFAAQSVAQGNHSLSATKAFTSLSIITLLTNPAAKLLSAIPSTAASLGCFDRIQKFLVSASKDDQRQSSAADKLSKTDSPSATAATGSEVELEKLMQTPLLTDSAVILEQVSLRASSSGDLILQDITLSVPHGSRSFIIGPIGCGKTTLLKAILGELAYEGSKNAFISVSTKRIAFCAQDAWLPNATIRQVICGPDTSTGFDEDWYRTTLSACALDYDIELFPEGDRTKIGTGGASLSGGQKHRIALARAVYARTEIIILDDVLSALDAKTQNTVVSRLLGESGIFKKLKTTVLLVTHATQFLSYADKVILLSDGTIQYDGDSDGFVQRGLINNLSLREINDIDTEPPKPSVKEKASQVSKANQLADLTRSTGDLDVYRYYFRSIGWLRGSIFVGFVIVNVFSSTFSQIWLKWWSDTGGGQIGLYISVYIVLGIITSISLGGYVWSIIILISPSTARKLHYTLLKIVMRAPQSFFSSTDIGTVLNRFTQDMTLIEGQLAIGVLVTVSNLFLSIASAGMVASGSTYMAINIPFLIGVICGLQHVYLSTSRHLRLLDLEARAPLYSHFLTSISGLTTIRAFKWEEASTKENYELLDYSQRPYYMLYCIQRWLTLVLDLIVGAQAVLVVGLAVGLRSSTSAGLLGVSLNNILTFNNNLASLVTGWTMLETSLGSIARIKDFEQDVKPEDKPTESFEPPASWPDQGRIMLSNVTASHDPESVGIHNVSLEIKQGQKVGVCGRTGSGKSSLVTSLLRLLEIDSGTITIDGLDLAKIPRDIIRERLVVIPQDPLILTGSVRLNADPYGGKSDEQIIASLKRVGLWSLLQDRGGLDSQMTESSLSKGQQQLFALARAILKGGKILLLDEATSNVDLDTDTTMQQVIKEEFSNCTQITVAHRLDTIINSDMIIVMDSGSVVEVGQPQQLLDAGGWLAELAKGQLRSLQNS